MVDEQDTLPGSPEPRHLATSIDLGKCREGLLKEIKSICSLLVDGWSVLDPKIFDVSVISGGITNLLWKVTPSIPGLEPVVLRVFGDKTEVLIDRENELRTLLYLNQKGFGARVLGTFDNGRVESFLNMRTCSTEDLKVPRISAGIAMKLRKLHGVRMPSGVRDPDIYKTIPEWLSIVEGLRFEDAEKQHRFEQIDIKAVAAQYKKVESIAEGLESETVLCHCDLLAGNILLPYEEDGAAGAPLDVQFIDYEYSAHNPFAFDIGNHFCEYAGPECNYANYPTVDEASHFVRHYLNACSDITADEGQVRRLVAEVNFFALMSHMYWGVWALVQARYSPIDFDFLEYHHLRMREFHRRKGEFIDAVLKVQRS
eukprot:jgi/Botrbrau1/22065/Bobra.0024s0074.1